MELLRPLGYPYTGISKYQPVLFYTKPFAVFRYRQFQRVQAATDDTMSAFSLVDSR